MKKADREIVFNKFGGKCSYCGAPLKKGWHVDHANPIERKQKDVGSYYRYKDTKEKVPNRWDLNLDLNNIEYVPRKIVADGCKNPQHDTIDNMMPACVSCNINKHSMNIEQFRAFIGRFVDSLNRDSTQYRIAKRYGLIKETNKPVVFYFETLKK